MDRINLKEVEKPEPRPKTPTIFAHPAGFIEKVRF